VARIALDADVVIAFLDPADAQHATAVEVLGADLAAGAEIVLAATVYAEVIVRPLQQGTDATVDEFLAAINADVVDVDRSLARTAAGLRGRHRRLRLPDAMALAAGLRRDARLLTLDHALRQIAEHEQ
jgi:predicted nucleic acid-binding protein